MFDDMFSFIEPIVELSEDNSSFIIQADTLFDFLQKAGLDKMEGLPQGAKIKIPLDTVMSLLKPDELEKLRNYITVYLEQQGNGAL
jgi:hypothetical protein